MFMTTLLNDAPHFYVMRLFSYFDLYYVLRRLLVLVQTYFN